MNPLILLPFVSMASADNTYEPSTISALVMDLALSGGQFEETRDAKIYNVDQYSKQNLQHLGWFKIPVFLDSVVFLDQGDVGLSNGDKLIYNFKVRVGGRNLNFKFEEEFHNSDGRYETCVYTDLPGSKCVDVSDFSKLGQNPSLIYQTTNLYRNKVGMFLDELSP
ncbi:hypothetical protein HN681_03740 [archaeon]|jgi:hypothetical protein|nr:hypothetical protein [archaeon]MBT3730408.1 hypothetical protein [archaeon]MBT4670391.1 hypothetical protein [archaeon]MBT5030144.1 hypothetical protein [archaeon]MBT5288165.1 hypothetical protein [archaeon]